ncbi:MAG TPA: hypothetical protein VFV74_08485 [Burkholderiales bacterium]|nr:hypothetical protein [Burkholderiales bacterium]
MLGQAAARRGEVMLEEQDQKADEKQAETGASRHRLPFFFDGRILLEAQGIDTSEA